MRHSTRRGENWRKMEVLWLKSHGLPHQQIADLTGVYLRTAPRSLGEHLQGGLKQVRRCKWREPWPRCSVTSSRYDSSISSNTLKMCHS
jgi:hypothetical protein